MPILYPCAYCGRNITTRKNLLCKKCQAELKANMNQVHNESHSTFGLFAIVILVMGLLGLLGLIMYMHGAK